MISLPQWSLKTSYIHLKNLRPIVKPKPNFLRQLIEFEKNQAKDNNNKNNNKQNNKDNKDNKNKTNDRQKKNNCNTDENANKNKEKNNVNGSKNTENIENTEKTTQMSEEKDEIEKNKAETKQIGSCKDKGDKIRTGHKDRNLENGKHVSKTKQEIGNGKMKKKRALEHVKLDSMTQNIPTGDGPIIVSTVSNVIDKSTINERDTGCNKTNSNSNSNSNNGKMNDTECVDFVEPSPKNEEKYVELYLCHLQCNFISM